MIDLKKCDRHDENETKSHANPHAIAGFEARLTKLEITLKPWPRLDGF